MAYLFDDASTQYLEWNNGATPTEVVPFSMSVWFRSDAAISQFMLQYCDKNVINAYFGIFLRVVSTNNVVTGYFRPGTGSDGIVNTTSYWSINTWHHAATVVTATNVYVWLDGAGKGTSTAGTFTGWPANRYAIGGARDSTPDSYFSGDLAEAATWNVALTDAEIAQLAAGYTPLSVRSGSLVFYHPLVRDLHELSLGRAVTAYNTPAVSDHPRVLHAVGPHVGVYQAAAATGQPTMARWQGIPGMKYNGRRGW